MSADRMTPAVESVSGESAAHTPTPWRCNGTCIDGPCDSFITWITGPDAEVSEANAAFIVEACNGYAALQSQLRAEQTFKADALEKQAAAEARCDALQSQNAELVKALETIASGARYSMYDTADCFKGLGECRDLARAALTHAVSP